MIRSLVPDRLGIYGLERREDEIVVIRVDITPQGTIFYKAFYIKMCIMITEKNFFFLN